VYKRLVPAPIDLRIAGEIWFTLAGRRGSKPGLANAQRILVIRPDRVGDIILTSPFLRELRRNLCAGARVSLLVRPLMADLVAHCPYVDEVITYRWDTQNNRFRFRRYAEAFSLARTLLWSRHFDLAVIPRWDVDQRNAQVTAYLSGARQRAGFVQPNSAWSVPGGNFETLLNQGFHEPAIRHEVEHMLRLIELLGGSVSDDTLELWLDDADRTFAHDFLQTHGYDPERPLVVMGPGAGEPKREWPAERFAAVATAVQGDPGVQVLTIGGVEDREKCEIIVRASGNKIMNAAGLTTLRQMAALLQYGDVYVGGDSGPMHMAAAAGAFVVEISCHSRMGLPGSPNSPLRFRPWGVPHIVLQPDRALLPCGEHCIANEPHCINDVHFSQVLAATRTGLAKMAATKLTDLSYSDSDFLPA